MTRLLDRSGPVLSSLRGPELDEAIRASEGRTVLAEVVAGASPLLNGTSNAELVAAFGADLICLNLAESRTDRALVDGLEKVDPTPKGFSGLAGFLGRPVGLNLEPDIDSVPMAYRASADNVRSAESAGAAFVMITANPGRGVTIEDLESAVRTARGAVEGMLCWAGKMHHSGAEEPLGPESVARLVAAGAQGALVPLPGTVPGISEGLAAGMVQEARSAGGLAIGTIATSQEGADRHTLRQLALCAKRIGVDVHHIGDAGFSGLASPESLYAYSVAARGIRHTWNRMARGPRASWSGKE
ncbi:MAG: haloacid dehalogenase-like hydrolase [Actinobacteria bacterium]|nr:haloacid dehalogenase-like hydrolase [Actinomycetota bacterium]